MNLTVGRTSAVNIVCVSKSFVYQQTHLISVLENIKIYNKFLLKLLLHISAYDSDQGAYI